MPADTHTWLNYSSGLDIDGVDEILKRCIHGQQKSDFNLQHKMARVSIDNMSQRKKEEKNPKKNRLPPRCENDYSKLLGVLNKVFDVFNSRRILSVSLCCVCL